MNSKKLAILTVLTVITGILSTKSAQAFCLFETDCPGGGATVTVDLDMTCKTDTDCPYGQQCNTAKGICFTPSTAFVCACTDDGDPCTDDAGTVTSSGGCFCPHNRLTTPECAPDGGAPIPVHRPINYPGVKVPLDPTTPDPVTPTDPTDPITPLDPTPVTPDPEPLPPPAIEIPPSDAACSKLPLEYQACCRDVKGDPMRVMKECVHDGSRASECDIVVNVMGGVGEKAQMNICCNVLNNSGSITDSKVTQECKNTFGTVDGESTDEVTASSGTETPDAAAHDSKTTSIAGAAPSGGCSLIR